MESKKTIKVRSGARLTAPLRAGCLLYGGREGEGDDRRGRRPLVLVVDDNRELLEDIADLLRQAGHGVLSASSCDEALEVARRARPDRAIVDVGLPDRSGLELLRDLRSLYPELPVVITSGHERAPFVMAAMRLGAANYLVKPFAADDLLRAFEPRPELPVMPEDDRPRSLDDNERAHIIHVLEHARWNISAAARVLKIPRQSLQRKMRQHGLTKPP